MPSEFELIDRHFARPTPGAVLGPGDDCALLQPTPGMQLAATTDMLVAGVHFLPETDPERLGWKTLAVNLSDLAAMGAQARWVLLAGAFPEDDEDWIAAFAKGFFALAQLHGVDVVGGDTTRGPLNLCVTALGELPPGQAITRSGARAEDDLWVSGTPGLASLGLAHAQHKTQLPDDLAATCLEALRQPQPRLALGRSLRRVASAAIDVSDGLLGDIGHLLERSKVGAEIRLDHLPPLPQGADPELARACQLGGGDDYELAFTAPASQRPTLAAVAAVLKLPLWRIGRITPAPGLRLLDEQGQELPLPAKGFDHFHAA